jgi:hypothetical protein
VVVRLECRGSSGRAVRHDEPVWSDTCLGVYLYRGATTSTIRGAKNNVVQLDLALLHRYAENVEIYLYHNELARSAVKGRNVTSWLKSTSFGHLQRQVVDVHLQSSVSGRQFFRVFLDRLNTAQQHCRL